MLNFKLLDMFVFQIQMQEGKENQFIKLLKKLQIDNAAIPELRQLKQEHAYLQKLRFQRTKVEQLKAKYDHAQAEIKECYIQMAEQKHLIEEQHNTIQILQQRLNQEQQRRAHLESSLVKAVDMQKEKQKQKNNQLLAEIQMLKEQSRSKDYALFEIEDQIQLKNKQLKEQLQQERKKMLIDCQQKISLILSEKNVLEQENQQLKQLVTRQHKALQLQNQQYQECNKRNEQLSQTISSLEEQLQQAIKLRVQAEEQVTQMLGLMQRMESELSQLRTGQNAKQQVEQLRKKVSLLAKGEIQRIQTIVNEFQ